MSTLTLRVEAAAAAAQLTALQKAVDQLKTSTSGLGVPSASYTREAAAVRDALTQLGALRRENRALREEQLAGSSKAISSARAETEAVIKLDAATKSLRATESQAARARNNLALGRDMTGYRESDWFHAEAASALKTWKAKEAAAVQEANAKKLASDKWYAEGQARLVAGSVEAEIAGEKASLAAAEKVAAEKLAVDKWYAEGRARLVGGGIESQIIAEKASLAAAKEANARKLASDRWYAEGRARLASGDAVAEITKENAAVAAAKQAAAEKLATAQWYATGRAKLASGSVEAEIIREKATVAAAKKAAAEKLAVDKWYAEGRARLLVGSIVAQEAAEKRMLSSATDAQHHLRGAIRGTSGALGGLWMTYTSIIPTVVAFTAAVSAIKGIKAGAEFEQITKYTHTIATGTGDASAGLEEIRQKVMAIRDVSDSPAVLAGAVKELVKAGFSAKEAMGEVEVLSKTATVVQEDLAVVTKGVAAQYRAWSDEAVGTVRGVSSITEAANMMAYAAAASATDFGELNQMLAYTTELGPLTGVAFNELLAGLAHMTNMGITGTKAATALRTSILRLQDPTSKASKMLESLRVPFSSTDAKGEFKDLTTLFEDLQKSMQPLTQKAKAELVGEIFGLRELKGSAAMIRGVVAAIDEGKFSFRGLSDELIKVRENADFVNKSFAESTDTISGQWSLFVADMNRSFTEAFRDGGPVRGLVDSLRTAAADGSLTSFIENVALLTSTAASAVGTIISLVSKVRELYSLTGLEDHVTQLSLLEQRLGAVGGQQTLLNAAVYSNPFTTMVGLTVGALSKEYEELSKLIAKRGEYASIANSAPSPLKLHDTAVADKVGLSPFARSIITPGSPAPKPKRVIPDPNTVGNGTDTLVTSEAAAEALRKAKEEITAIERKAANELSRLKETFNDKQASLDILRVMDEKAWQDKSLGLLKDYEASRKATTTQAEGDILGIVKKSADARAHADKSVAALRESNANEANARLRDGENKTQRELVAIWEKANRDKAAAALSAAKSRSDLAKAKAKADRDEDTISDVAQAAIAEHLETASSKILELEKERERVLSSVAENSDTQIAAYDSLSETISAISAELDDQVAKELTLAQIAEDKLRRTREIDNLKNAGSVTSEELEFKLSAKLGGLKQYDPYAAAKELAAAEVSKLDEAHAKSASKEGHTEAYRLYFKEGQDKEKLREQLLADEIKAVDITERAKNSIIAKAAEERKSMMVSDSRAFISATSATLGSIAAMIGESDKKSFERSKRFQLAQAYIDTAAGAAGAFADTHGHIIVRIAAGVAAFAAGMARVQQIRQTEYQGQAHDGMPFVPSTGTYTLEKGERVVKKEDNRMLEKFLAEPKQTGPARVNQVNVTITTVDAPGVERLLSQNEGLINKLVQDRYDQNLRTGGPYR